MKNETDHVIDLSSRREISVGRKLKRGRSYRAKKTPHAFHNSAKEKESGNKANFFVMKI